eukprot:2431103-Rhodomonas_salina.1
MPVTSLGPLSKFASCSGLRHAQAQTACSTATCSARAPSQTHSPSPESPSACAHRATLRWPRPGAPSRFRGAATERSHLITSHVRPEVTSQHPRPKLRGLGSEIQDA